jgi:hypothetical protein
MNTIIPMKKTLSRSVLLGALPLLVLLGGCIDIGAHTQARLNPTIGQQLIDLQKARDSGALSEPEYENQRAKLLNLPPSAIFLR